MTESLKPLTKEHASEAARLHTIGLPRAFLTSLGPPFLRHLYTALPECPSAFGYVWEADGAVRGFIACTESTGRVYRQALRRRGVRMALAILPRLARWSVLKGLVETLLYPAKVEEGKDEGMPSAEILSIAVDESLRGKGVGRRLIEAAFEEFRRRSIYRVKVAVGVRNLNANAFYERCGFHLQIRCVQHNKPMNVYAAEIAREGPATVARNEPEATATGETTSELYVKRDNARRNEG